jgi:hypothetical protein
MESNAVTVRRGFEYAYGQKRYAKPGRDAAYNRFNCPEFKLAQTNGSSSRQYLFEALPVGAPGAEDNDLEVSFTQQSFKRTHGRGGCDNQLLTKYTLLFQRRVFDRTAYKSALQLAREHGIDQLSRSAGFQHQIDFRKSRDIFG